MLLIYLLYTYLVLGVVLGIITGIFDKKLGNKFVIKTFEEASKIIFPLFALISVFIEMDYYSLCFIAYLSGYYVLEALYHLFLKMKLSDCQANKFSPNFLETKARTTISIFTLTYFYGFHMLCFHLITQWLTISIAGKVFAILGLLILSVLSFLGLALVLFDFYTMFIFPIVNNLINKTIKNLDNLTYKQLLKVLNFVSTFFTPVYSPEIETKFKVKKLQAILKYKLNKSNLASKINAVDKEVIATLLSQFQEKLHKGIITTHNHFLFCAFFLFVLA